MGAIESIGPGRTAKELENLARFAMKKNGKSEPEKQKTRRFVRRQK